MTAWHRTPGGGLRLGPYPADQPGYAEAAREAYDTDRAVPFDDTEPSGGEA